MNESDHDLWFKICEEKKELELLVVMWHPCQIILAHEDVVLAMEEASASAAKHC